MTRPADSNHADFGKAYWRTATVVGAELPPSSSSDVDEATFRLLADSLPTLCWIANGDGYIIWYNRRWYDYTGTTPAQMEGWGWTAVHDPALLPNVMARWQASIDSGAPFEMTFPLRGADGEFRPFLTRVVPVHDMTGAVKRWCGVNTKIADQVAAEEALRVERDRSREVLDSMGEGFMLLDHDFRVLDINAEGLRLDGRNREHIIGRPHREAWPDSGDERVDDHHRQAMADRRFFSTEHLYHRPGQPGVWLEVRGFPVSDGLALFYRDVTARKEAEDALRRSETQLRDSEARYRGIVEGAEDFAIVTLDQAGGITSWNVGAERLLGFTEGEAIGRPGAIFFTPEDRERGAPDHEMNRASVSGRAVDERWHARRDGSRFWGSGLIMVLEGGGFLKIFRDRTVEHEAELAMRGLNETLEQRVQAAIAERDRTWANSRDLLVVIDTAGAFRAVNPAWTTILGWSETELVGAAVFDFIHPDDMEVTAAALATATAGPLPVVENRYRHKGGSYRWISWVAAPEGDLIYATGRDVTAEKERQAELEHTQEALRQAQKMEAVGQLTGGIAHDFNNLLTGVIGSLDMMQRRIARGEIDKLERYATTAMTSANRAAALTHRLLAFSRRQPLDPKPTNANRLITGMEELLRRTIGESVRLEIVTAGGLWRTLCDPHQLDAAILNLAINARDAMPGGGMLTIETCNAHLDNAYAARQREVTPGQYICVCVTDTGVGMTPDVITKAFEPFFTTKPIGQGTGLGLSMIYGFARQSEGYAKIYSEAGQGATIKLYLPRYYGKAEDAEDVAHALTDAHRSHAGEVVVVVEDETAVRDLVVDVLQELGYRAVEAVDGPGGLKLLQSDMRVDLLVTDVGLPGLNGRQLADHARERRPGLKVLFMTGYAENATIANGFLEPGMQMITKPFAIEALVTRIRDMIEDG